ncbi:DNA-processing protein DprA [Halalkalibacter alkalisediminis]|uniref:DNA-processing protein DprA n=1 Tax=Halalkalibacter alkalisediminis TaxID=935616 RepID=A0ABV6NEN3_9BACI|nr:DNA-processing protein DprA [Halalkalibacter alkalisediminis]
MSEFRLRLIHLHSCREISRNILCKILQRDNHLKLIYDYSIHQWQTLFQLSPKNANSVFKHLHSCTPQQLLNYFHKNNIHIITIEDQEYPLLLKQIFDPPFVLYAMGRIEVLFDNRRLAVIGTRVPSEFGVAAVAKLVPPLAEKGWTIVSGLAKGIDSITHSYTINTSGHTIAVLGSGFNYMYPKENIGLFLKLSQKHLVLTEYPPHTPPRKWHFPARNRIISGLSHAVLVIEAKEKSGSLITADQALEQGRDVFAVPGSIFSEQSKGTNYLIQQGAKLITSEEDILLELED